MTGLLVLALLVLASLAPAAIPTLTWAPAPAPAQHVHPVGFDHGPHEVDAAPAGHEQDHPAGGHRNASPALACCVAMHCPMLTGALPGAPVQPSPPSGSPVSEAVVPRRLAGLSIPPALPPPRAA